ncbi:MAG: hypothetical protein ACRENB_11155 [Gemmatimonadales bacterium]
MPRKLLTAVVAVVLAAPVAAQSTGTPVFHAPYRAFERHEYGLALSDQGNLTLEAHWGFSSTQARWDFAIRGGIQDTQVGDAAFLVGVDARYRVIDQTADFPLDGAFVTGVGASLVSGSSRLFVPLGISLGRRVNFEGSEVSLVPYVQPVVMPVFGDGDEDIAVALGLGGDLRLSRRFEIRLGIGLGDIESFSIGFSFTR